MSKSAIFISYRREDCTGYAGRLEDTLEGVFGTGTVFRDMRDIAAGESFSDVIESCLSTARVVLVLIGPRWMGARPDGTRRIDGERDFVRLEIATALESGCKVIPILVSGTSLPRAEDLPASLRPLTRRQSLSLHEASWDSDIKRLIRSLDFPSLRRRRLVMAGAGAALLAVGGAAAYLMKPPAPVDAALATAEGLIGIWQAQVRYAWGDAYEERFVFERFAGALTGTASFLEYPRGIEDLIIDGSYVSFATRTQQSMNDQERQLTHRYTAEFDGGVLRFRMHTTGGFGGDDPPLEFAARPVAAEQ
jgi:hypothetical protein